jgi:Hint domain/Bacterial Ig domain
MVDATKLPVEIGIGADKMAEAMFGATIKIVSASYQGDPNSAGIWSYGDKIAPDLTPSDRGVILSTGNASGVTNAKGEANQSWSLTTDTKGVDNDAGMNSVAGMNTYDGAIFKADFVPQGSYLTMKITFSSEEYQGKSVTGWNDAVGVWVNGEKMQLTVGRGDITVNNINGQSNAELYNDNATDKFNTEMNGFTVTMTLHAPVKAGEVNSIKIGIADGGDAAYDSNLLIAGDSIQTGVMAVDDAFQMGLGDKVGINLLGNDQNPTKGALTITQINGQDVKEGSIVLLPNGVEVIVNGDGTVTIVSDYDDKPGETAFSYQVTDAEGNIDTGLVQGNVVPCFVAGMRVATPSGLTPVEALRPGDMVVTLDHGPQPVRWAGATTVAVDATTAPVSVPADTFGKHGELQLSAQHRICLVGWAADLICGTPEILVRARHLVAPGAALRDTTRRSVRYVHLMFDRHEIIQAEGVWCESYRPGPRSMSGHSPAVQAELKRLFPQLETDPQKSHAPLARLEAKADEVAVMIMLQGVITPEVFSQTAQDIWAAADDVSQGLRVA